MRVHLPDQADSCETDDQELLTAVEFADRARVTVRAVRKWADQGVGPVPIRPPGSRLVRYRRVEVDRWLSGLSVRELETP